MMCAEYTGWQKKKVTDSKFGSNIYNLLKSSFPL